MIESAHELLAYFWKSRRVLLTGPEGPDGDSIGASLALRRILSVAAPGVVVDVAGQIPERYTFLPDSDRTVPESGIGHYDGVVVLDGDATRLTPAVGQAFAGAAWTGIIDHHRSTSLDRYAVSVFDPNSESTCGMIWQLAKAWSVAIDQETATLLYTGLIFDTGSFRHANTRVSTHLLAAELVGMGIDHSDITRRVLLERRATGLHLMGQVLAAAQVLANGKLILGVCSIEMMQRLGAISEDIEGIVDMLQQTTGVELAVLVVEKAPQQVKLSMRSQGGVDVAALAKSLNNAGGGHMRAAGTTLREPLPSVMGWLPGRLEAQLSPPSTTMV